MAESHEIVVDKERERMVDVAKVFCDEDFKIWMLTYSQGHVNFIEYGVFVG